MTKEQVQKVLDEMRGVRPECLEGEAKRLFEAIMKIADERDEAYNVIKNKDKIIDLMLEEISNNIINTCPLEDYNYDLDCENKCNDNYKECWKQYFENKAKEEKYDKENIIPKN